MLLGYFGGMSLIGGTALLGMGLMLAILAFVVVVGSLRGVAALTGKAQIGRCADAVEVVAPPALWVLSIVYLLSLPLLFR